MPNVNTVVDAEKISAPKDWHKADIICGLWKLGTSVQKLSRENNYTGNRLEICIRKPWPKAERIIAEALGTTPQAIWPSRYHADGTPKSGRGERGIGDPRKGMRKWNPKWKNSASTTRVNARTRRAA